MKETLSEALAALFAGPGLASTVPGPAAEISGANSTQTALDHYNQAMERLKSGDWAGFGAQMDLMRGLLEKLGRQSDNPNLGKHP
jgi:uncharacterized protein